VIAPADLRALGVSPCGCGAVYKRTSRPWICGPGCVPNAGRGGRSLGAAGKDSCRADSAGRAGFLGASGHEPGSVTPSPSRHTKAAAVCDALADSLRALGVKVKREERVCAERRWRMDLYLPEHELAVEVDGGAYSGGHTRGKAYETDCEKTAAIARRGCRLVRVTNGQVKSGKALALVRRATGGAE
jgi:very-short-patch-repair endonuclease